MILEDIRNLIASAPIGKGLHHGHHFGGRLQTRLKKIQVMYQRAQIDLHDGAMHSALDTADNLFKSKNPCSLYEDHLIMQAAEIKILQEFFRRKEEHRAGREIVLIGDQHWPDTDKRMDVCGRKKGRYFFNESGVGKARFMNIGKYDALFAFLVLMRQKVKTYL